MQVHTPRLPELLWSNLECLGFDQNIEVTKEELSRLTCELKEIFRYRLPMKWFAPNFLLTEDIMQQFHAIKISVDRGNGLFCTIQ